MCYSATASFAGAAVVGTLGVGTLALVRHRRELPFAALSLGFGLHQALEGVIWTQLDANHGAPVQSVAVDAWILYAWVLLPLWLPMAVRMLEDDPVRRRLMRVPALIGVGTSGFLLVATLFDRAVAQVGNGHLEYVVPVHPGWLVAIPYVVATCGSAILSSRGHVKVWGAFLTVGMLISAARDARQFSSVWCFIAAWLGLGVFVHYAVEAWRSRQATALESAAA